MTCIDVDSPSGECFEATLTLQLAGAPPVLVEGEGKEMRTMMLQLEPPNADTFWI